MKDFDEFRLLARAKIDTLSDGFKDAVLSARDGQDIDIFAIIGATHAHQTNITLSLLELYHEWASAHEE